jgi:hypothetical protein
LLPRRRMRYSTSRTVDVRVSIVTIGNLIPERSISIMERLGQVVEERLFRMDMRCVHYATNWLRINSNSEKSTEEDETGTRSFEIV